MTEQGSIFLVTKGEYSDYKVVCGFEQREDAEAAVSSGLGEEVAEMPMMPAGRIPRRKPVYRASAFIHGTDQRHNVRPRVEIRDGWDFDPDLDEFDDDAPAWGAGPGSRFITALSNDRERALKRVADAYAKLRAQRGGL